MRQDVRRRRMVVIAASIAAHAAVIAVVAVHAPRLLVPPVESGPPEPIIPILLMPRALPPSPATGDKPEPLRLHRRPQRFVEEEMPVAPLILPEAKTQANAEEAARRAARSAPPAPNPLETNARKALQSRRNCNDPSLTRAEREACEERFAAGARDEPFLGLGIEGDKASDFARAAARKEAARREREAPLGLGTAGMSDPSAPGRTVIPPTTPAGSTRDGTSPPPGSGRGDGGGPAAPIRF